MQSYSMMGLFLQIFSLECPTPPLPAWQMHRGGKTENWQKVQSTWIRITHFECNFRQVTFNISVPWFHQSVDGVNKIMHFVVIRWSTGDNPTPWNSHWHLVSAPEITAVVSHLAGQRLPSPCNSDFSHLPLTIPFFCCLSWYSPHLLHYF